MTLQTADVLRGEMSGEERTFSGSRSIRSARKWLTLFSFRWKKTGLNYARFQEWSPSPSLKIGRWIFWGAHAKLKLLQKRTSRCCLYPSAPPFSADCTESWEAEHSWVLKSTVSQHLSSPQVEISGFIVYKTLFTIMAVIWQPKSDGNFGRKWWEETCNWIQTKAIVATALSSMGMIVCWLSCWGKCWQALTARFFIVNCQNMLRQSSVVCLLVWYTWLMPVYDINSYFTLWIHCCL